IKGLTFANLKGPKSAIYIAGTSHHIRIINNVLRDMTWVDEASEDENNPKPSDNLNPIAVIGNHPTQPVNNIFIRGNQLSEIVPGYSEGIKIVGNVTDFVVAKNHIHNIANIGIVAAGNYTWIKDSSGKPIPAEVNHARDGVIRNNVVHNAVSPIANSAGIYLDGARNVMVRGNTSYNNSVGFSVGSEQPGDASGNTLKRNIAYGNTDAGLVVGTVHADAVVNDTTIVNNEFRNNYTKGEYGGEMTIQSVNGLKVRSNLFSSRSDVIVVVSQPSNDLELDNNLYYGASNDPDVAVFDWGGMTGMSYVGMRNFQAATCQDLKSIYQDAETIKYLDRIKRKHKNKGKDKDKEMRQIKRACYKRSKLW
ncbi:MAG: right-handed parallel beta-helix repeat-containing protein, partial [Leucothrix sp.]